MIKLIRPVMAATAGNEPYDEEMWYNRNNELSDKIDDAYKAGIFSKDEYFILIDRLENITPYRPYENLSVDNKLKCSDKLDQLSHEVKQYIKDRQ